MGKELGAVKEVCQKKLPGIVVGPTSDSVQHFISCHAGVSIMATGSAGSVVGQWMSDLQAVLRGKVDERAIQRPRKQRRPGEAGKGKETVWDTVSTSEIRWLSGIW